MHWGYLREKNSKGYTSLQEYLEYIFPENDFVYDSIYSKESFIGRSNGIGSIKYHRYRPDAISENLSMVVEFDGTDHYTSYNAIINDHAKDDFYSELGYKIVRIPYWVQLSTTNIEYLFGVHIDDPMCELSHSFRDSGYKGIPGAQIGPGSMCELGRMRFIDEFNDLPDETKTIVLLDLMECVRAEGPEEDSIVLPRYVFDRLEMPSDSVDLAKIALLCDQIYLD